MEKTRARKVKNSGDYQCRLCIECGAMFPEDSGELQVCPSCGKEGRCSFQALPGVPACQRHGGKMYMAKQRVDSRGDLVRTHYLPKRLLSSYNQALEDHELLILRRDLALVESRINDLTSRADSGESGWMWKKMRELREAYRHALATNEDQIAATYLDDMFQLIDVGDGDFHIWEEIGKETDRRKRLVESERKRLIEMHNVITVERVMGLMEKVAHVIEDNVEDLKVQQRIGFAINQLITANSVKENVNAPRIIPEPIEDELVVDGELVRDNAS